MSVRWKEVVFRAKEAQDSFTEVPSPEIPNGEKSRAKVKPHPRLGTVKDKKVLPEPLPTDHPSPLRKPEYVPEGFCDHCYVPLPDDPDPETLFIYLHALRYTTETLGSWETPLPRWAGTGLEGDWRGWSDDATPAPFDNVEPDSTFSFTAKEEV